jgi:hypothetical protein
MDGNVVGCNDVLFATVTNSHMTSSSLSLSLSGRHTRIVHTHRSRSLHVFVPQYHADAFNCCISLPIILLNNSALFWRCRLNISMGGAQVEELYKKDNCLFCLMVSQPPGLGRLLSKCTCYHNCNQ